jgi:hypothetical protein
MKYAITLILFFWGNWGMAQYVVNWEINNSCKNQITDSSQKEIKEVDVQRSQKITLNIYSHY